MKSHSATAIFPGTFDPFTFGHHDIITRGLRIFDHVVVAVLFNPSKTTLFSVEERVELIRHTFADSKDKVEVQSFSGLLVDFAKSRGARVIIRGLRAVTDYDYEAQMALMNKRLSSDIETFFLTTSEQYSYVSSTMVKQVALLGGAVSHAVPPVVEAALRSKFEKRGS